MSSAAPFLSAYFQGITDSHLCLWTKQDKQSYSFPLKADSNVSIAAAMERAQHLDQERKDVYFCLMPSRSPQHGSTRSKEADATALVALWADVDLANGVHPSGKKYPSSKDDVDKAFHDLPVPTFIIHSGGGFHYYWLLDVPMVISNEEELRLAKKLSSNWQQVLRTALNSLGYAMDSTADLARILRVPGTQNYKDASNPKPVEVLYSSETRYSRSVFEGLIEQKIAQAEASSASLSATTAAGFAAIPLRRCVFVQHCQKNALTLSEPDWHAMVSNLAMCADGDAIIHELSQPYPRYSNEETQKKIDTARTEQKPITCEYIKGELGFGECKNCPVKAPIGWASSQVGQATDSVLCFMELEQDVRTVTNHSIPDEVKKSLALLQLKNLVGCNTLIQRLHEQFPQIALRSFRAELNAYTRELEAALDAKYNEEAAIALEAAAGYKVAIPKGYAFTDRGIELCSTKGRRVVLPQVVIVSRVYKSPLGDRAEVLYNRGAGYETMLVARKTLANASELIQLSAHGLLVDSSTALSAASYFTAFFLANEGHFPVLKGTPSLGWQPDGSFLPGLSPARLLKEDSVWDETSSLAGNGTVAAWSDAMRPLRAFMGARLAMAASFAAPLVHLLEERTFLVHLWGPSRGGKTASQMAALSMWLKPSTNIVSFNATAVALEVNLGYLKNLPFMINERQQAGSNQQFLDKIVYMLGEGQGRARGTRSGGLRRVHSWQTIIITSGEHPLTNDSSAEGTRTRTLEIFSENFIGDDALASSMYSITEEQYGTAGVFALAYVLDHLEEVRQEYARRKQEISQQHPGLLGSYYGYSAILATADRLLGEILYGESTEAAEESAQALIEHIIASISTPVPEHQRAYEYLQDWVAANERRFTYEGNPSAGWYEGPNLYFLPASFNEVLTAGEFHPARIRRDFAQEGLIRRGPNEFTVTRTNPHSDRMTRVLHLPNFLNITENEFESRILSDTPEAPLIPEEAAPDSLMN